MSNAEDFMNDARQAVAERRNTASQKVKTMVWYAGRGAVRDAPKMALTKIGAAIPFPGVGGAVNWAVEKVIDRVVAKRKEKKRARYAVKREANGDDVESLRKHAKAQSKEQKVLAEKIDGNLVKLKDAAMATDIAIDAFNTARSLPQGKPKDAAWKLACALYETQHYEEKLQLLVETMRTRLEAVEEYVAANREKTSALEDDLSESLGELESAGVDIVSQQYVPPRSASGYGRLG